METESLPRLSSRLLLTLYGLQTSTSDELLSHRKQLVDRNLSFTNVHCKSSFTIDQFLGNQSYSLPEDVVHQINFHFKEYLHAIAELTSDAVLHKNAALTMFNIINNCATRDKSYADAKSYFGFIDRELFNRTAMHATALRDLSSKAQVDLKIGHHAPFGADLEFEVPSSSVDANLLIWESDILHQSVGSDEEEPQSYVSNPVEGASSAKETRQDIAWLEDAINNHLRMHSSALNRDQFFKEILRICKSETDLEGRLFELIGESNIEFLMMVVQNAEEIKNLAPSTSPSLKAQFPAPIKVFKESDYVSSQSAAFEAMSTNQKKKVLQREQKEMEMLMKVSETSGSERGQYDFLQRLGFNEDYLREERALGLQKNRTFESWTENLAPTGTREYYEKKGLPTGATRTVGNGFEEVFIPAAKRPGHPREEDLVGIDVLDEWARPAFAGTKYLNRIQSVVFPCAYYSSENMLVCAPTGAGKTNIAMLTLLQLSKLHLSADGTIDKANMKAIYIAPMKALAQEVVSKFSERLSPLGLVVKEYTGDMQLTKQEITEANLLVCTPEKYDVATRKGGDGSLGTLVSLIIIDEVHLLADERGAVIETIVARTQRYVESSQRIVRIVGLSATLPNYQDVATFLRVNASTGLFFFGPEYRPIPLDQTFVGITEKQRLKRNTMMNKLAYDKMIAALDAGKQVMIFVHSRKDTSRTLESILEFCAKYGTYDRLENVHHEKYTIWKREVDKSKSQEVQNLFYKGVGVHHAGMLRSDRTLVEQLFECGLLKVLCCTATLAWGVNLPAHTVIIKGTEMYDPERGGFVDLSILDVLQIFGRAGRPQYDNTGHAILITPHKSLALYLGMLAHQAPIESALIKALPDHLNAEIVNGTVNNIKEAAAWLSYTFLFVRMRQNPLIYGITYEETFVDPQLETKRLQLVRDAADTLDTCMMTRFDKRSGNLGVTDLGRIASHYYIKHTTVQSFNNMLAPHLSDSDAVHVLCSSAEFDQLKVRPEELSEIDQLKKFSFWNVKTTSDDTAGKVSVLLQGYLSHARVASFTLQSDTNYVAQNAGRIARALFEVCLKRGWSTIARYYLCLCKSIDRRVRMDHSPMRQFSDLPMDILKKIEDAEVTYEQLVDMDSREIGELIHNQKFGPKVKELVHKLPMLMVEAKVQPITRGIIRMTITLTPSFDWVDRYHGQAEPFWIWVEDGENEYVYHSEYYILLKRQKNEIKVFEVTIPVRDPLPPQYYIRVISDVWVGCETVTTVSFQHVMMPTMLANAHTNLMDLHPLPKTALQNPLFEELYSFSHFNPIQTQTFYTLYNTDRNVLVGAPTGSGKTVTAELAFLRLLRAYPGKKTVYVAPLKALARERLLDWQKKLGSKLGIRVLELSGEITPDIEDLRKADILIVTPEKWDGISRGWQKREYVKQVGLLIIDEIHLLGVDRGPVLEVIVSRMRFIAAQTGSNVRFVGLSTALANARDLGDWLGIEEGTSRGAVGLYNFRPSVRPVPMSIHIQGFPAKHYCPRMATMNKPAYAAILEHSPTKPVLIFVSSRRQTRLTALDLISYCAADDDPKRFLHMPEEDAMAISGTMKDKALRDTLVFGVGIHHAGLDNADRATVEELFLNNKIQILVCTSTLAWGVNLPCHLVIVKGTEYFDGKSKGYVDFPVTDILQMMGRAGRPQFDDSAVACIFVHEPKKTFYRKFLHEPFPVESSLHLQLHEHINAEIANGTIHNLPDAIEYLTWTYYFRRLLINPSYYQLEDASPAGVQDHLMKLISAVVNDLQSMSCLEIVSEETATPYYSTTAMGKITSYYYLNYRTPHRFMEQFQRLNSHFQSSGLDTGERSKATVPIDILIKIMCDALEFSELPVRHNEEHLNADLALELGLSPSSPMLGSMESPHTKAFLLLYAFLRKARLPISDYINDTKSVFDQVPRVLNAMIDIAAEAGFALIVIGLMHLSQLLCQGIPDSEYTEFHQMKIFDLDVIQAFKRKGIKGMRGFLRQGRRNIEIIGRELLGGMEIGGGSAPRTSLLEEFLNKLDSIPGVFLKDVIIRQFSENPQSERKIYYPVLGSSADSQYSSLSAKSDRKSAIYIPSHADCEIEIKVSIPNDGKSSSSKTKKSPSWWILLVNVSSTIGNEESSNFNKEVRKTKMKLDGSMELLALKRLGPLRDNQTTTLYFSTPETACSWPIKILLVNDSFVGIDQELLLENVQID